MSLDAMRAVWDARRADRIDGRAVLTVAFVLAQHTNGSGEAYAGVRLLADETGYGRATVERALSAIVGAGLYRVVVTAAGRRATTYRLALSPRAAKPVDDDDVAARHKAANRNGLARVVAHDSDVVAHSDSRSGPLATDIEKHNLETRFVPASDVPERVADLRTRLAKP